MKHYICISFISLLLAVAPSCKKSFLDIPDYSMILQEQFVTDLRTAEQYVTGMHLQLSLFYGSVVMIYPELVADNVKPSKTLFVSQYNWAQAEEDNSTNMSSYWQSGFNLIRSCNFAMSKIDEFASENTGKANNLKAQALTIRALVNSVLVSMFAQSYNFTAGASHLGIPYVTDYDWNKPVTGRATVAEVYMGMISDLTTAISLFPDNGSTTLYLSRNAAKVLLARIYLFKEDYPLAKSLANEITSAVPLLTIAGGYPVNLYKYLPSGPTEAIYQMAPSSVGATLLSPAGGTYTGTQGINFLGRYFGTPASQNNFLATADIKNLLTADAADVRKAWIKPGNANNDTIAKFPSGLVAGINPANNAYYQTIFRSSEMFLTVAEAAAKTNDENTARTYLDFIRQRANPSIAPVTATGAALLDSIYTERRRELCFEGLRMYDLLRWKKGVNRTDALGPSVKILPYPSDKAIAPIPAPDVNIIGLPQNQGY